MTGIILAHGAVTEVVERHRPNWLTAFSQIILISPADDPIPGSLLMGDSGKSGRGTLERLMFAMVIASRFSAAAILEYDALVFENLDEARIPAGQLLCSQVFYSNDPTFTSPTYGHCPWVACGEDWWRILTAGADAQKGVPDRWLALACQNAGVELRTAQDSFSNDKEWSLKTVAEAVAARKNGALFIHGVKTRLGFEAVTSKCRT